jgi:hypothetical protein
MRYFLYIAIIAMVYTGYSALTDAAEAFQHYNIARQAQIMSLAQQ